MQFDLLESYIENFADRVQQYDEEILQMSKMVGIDDMESRLSNDTIEVDINEYDFGQMPEWVQED
jgi:hypothetical protein